MDAQNCRNCGNPFYQGARFCPRCGVATADGPPSAVDPPNQFQSYQPYAPPVNPAPAPQPRYADPQPYQQPYYQQPAYPQPYTQPYSGGGQGLAPVAYYPQPKDKSVAVLLAVFLGWWTWVYTHKKDAWKFWLCLGLSLTVFNPLWTVFVLLLPNIGLWIWAIVDAASKRDDYYRNFPNG